MITSDVEKEFQAVFDAIDNCAERIKILLRAKVSQWMSDVVKETNKFQEKLNASIKMVDPKELRNECITFLRDYNIKESYKGTEFVIYALLNHHSSENIKISKLVDEIIEVYKIPPYGCHSVRGNLNNALKSVNEEFITPKECLYFLLREWELYKQEKELE